MEIRYLQHHEIDFQKWDRCIKKSVNGSIYAYSWFLNIVSTHWDALVDEKYETVMPLTYKILFGHKILYQPAFASNLGVFSSNVLDGEIVNSYIKSIPRNFLLLNINLNKYNKITEKVFCTKRDCVYELDLIPSYKRISNTYSDVIHKRLMNGGKNKISISSEMNPNDLIHLYLNNKNIIQKILLKKSTNKLKLIIYNSLKFRVGQVYGAFTPEKNLCAAAFFIWSHNKAFQLILGFNKTGIKEYAPIILLDEFIKLHAEQNLTLRFEYTSQKKYAALYMGFGARRYEFTKIRSKGMHLFF